MQLLLKIRLFRSPFTICYMTEDQVLLPDENYYKLIGVNTGDCHEIDLQEFKPKKLLKLTTSAFFLQPFLKECLNSKIYRSEVLINLSRRSGHPCNGKLYLKLELAPPTKEIIDFAWNDRLLKLVWSRVEIENAFSWLSTLGGAYSALGDYFDYCAEEAGRISVRQYKLSKMLGDDSLAARSKLYSALSYSQRGYLKLARHIVRDVAAFGRATHDKRLVRMCQGVWVKLRYLRKLQKYPKLTKVEPLGIGNGEVIMN